MTKERLASRALLLAGYPLASWGGSRLGHVWRTGHHGPVLAFETGAALVTAGLLLRRKRFLAVLNGATGVGLAVAWLSRRRRHR